MAYAKLSFQDTQNTVTANNITVSYPNQTSAGNLLVATVYALGIALGSTTISGWTQAVSVSFLSAVDEASIFYKVATGTEGAVAASCSGATVMDMAIHEFFPGNTPLSGNPLDKTNSNSTAGSVATLNTGSITPTTSNQLIVAMMSFPTGGTSGWYWDSGLVTIGGNANMCDGYSVSNPAAAVNPNVTWSGASTAGGCIASFTIPATGDISPYRHLAVGNGISRSEVAS